MIRVARIVLMVSLALWVGGLATLSFVVAPTAFHVARPVAGQIVGASLRTFGVVEIVCGVLAVAASVFLRYKTGRGKPLVGVIIMMLLLTLVYVGVVYPAAAGAREEMNRPDAHEFSAQERFALYHRVSVWMVGTNILLGTIALSFAAVARTDGP